MRERVRNPRCHRGVSKPAFSGLALFLFIVFVFIALPVLSGHGKAAHTFVPRRDISAPESLCVEISTEVLYVESGNELPLTVTVTHRGYPVTGAFVNLTGSPNYLCAFEYVNHTTDENGQVFAYLRVEADRSLNVDIMAEAYMENYTSNSYVLKDIVVELPRVLLDGSDIIYVGIGGTVAVCLVGTTEAGKYALLKLFIVPLYSRLSREDVLDHFVRGQIYGYIMSHPGEHYNAIKMSLQVNNGTLSHHLRTLELQGYIKSQRDGTYKRFYPVGTSVPRRRGIQLSDLQMGIIDTIRQTPGITQKEIAKLEGITQQSVSYNLSSLERLGVLTSQRIGIRKRYFITQETAN